MPTFLSLAMLLLFIVISPQAEVRPQETNLTTAYTLKNQGKYQEAAGIFERLASGPDSASGRAAREGWLECLLMSGNYSKVVDLGSVFEKSFSEDSQVLIIVAKALQCQGQNSKAEYFLRKAAEARTPSGLEAQVELALQLKSVGKQSDSQALFSTVLESLDDQGNDPMGLTAIALQNLGHFREADSIFKKATANNPNDFDLWIAWGELYLEKYNPTDAATIFADVLKRNPNHPDALVGLALSMSEGQAQEVEQILERALQINPNLEKAYATRAHFRIQAEDYRGAESDLMKCFAINPNSLRGLTSQAVLYFAREDVQKMKVAVDKAFDINPSYGEVYEALGHFCVTQHLYEQAVQFFQKAVQRQPALWTAHAALGVNLLRTGKEGQAKEVLEVAFKNDPYNLWAFNTLKLLDSHANFDSFQNPHFVLRLHKKEAELLELYVPQLLEQAYQSLSAKYGFTPTSKIYFEMYPDHEDFAVRALGVPGLGALGVCFGTGIVMDSPSARPKDGFNWGSTLWHEFAHVITMGLTDHHVPRWFTEGISVMEEKLAKPGWGGDVNLEVIKSIQNRKILPINELDSGFLRPKFPGQVQLSYFQAGEVCQMIVQDFGLSALQRMLQLFKTRVALSDVLNGVLRLSPEAFDLKFSDFLISRYGRAIKETDFSLQIDNNILSAPEKLKAILQRQPDNFFANLSLAGYYRRKRDYESAIACLTVAKSVFPNYVDEENPYKQLSQIYAEKGLLAEAINELLALAHRSDKDFDSFKQLSAWLIKSNRRTEAKEILESAIYIYPFDPETHQTLAMLSFEKGDFAIALREYRALVLLNPGDPAEAHLNVARVLLEMGQRQEAKKEVLKSLEIAPSYDPAQELLLRTLDSPERNH
jgi:tetratricopeptide (TPR) repeat protein